VFSRHLLEWYIVVKLPANAEQAVNRGAGHPTPLIRFGRTGKIASILKNKDNLQAPVKPCRTVFFIRRRPFKCQYDGSPVLQDGGDLMKFF